MFRAFPRTPFTSTKTARRKRSRYSRVPTCPSPSDSSWTIAAAFASKRPELITAGLAFVGASNPQDQVFVVNFNDKVRSGLPTTTPFTDDVKLLRLALLENQPEGRTALYDAIAFALHHVDSGQRDKKALVVVSDGGDNCSTHSLTQLMRLVQESHTTIYTVGIFDADDADRNPQVLKRIASASGGECFLPADLSSGHSHLSENRKRHPKPLYDRVYPGPDRRKGRLS